ncbi:lysozyme [bacterium]|nr:lysozyme [bacterium]
MWLDIFPDGKVYEMDGEKAVDVRETDNEVEKLKAILESTTAGKFAIAPESKKHPEVAPHVSSGVPQAAINLIKEYEGYHRRLNDGTDRVRAYPDPGPRGWSLPTIGYGTTRYPDNRPVGQDDIITHDEAERSLWHEVEVVCRSKLERIPTWSQMNENQRSALYSFAYNLGASFYQGPSFDSITSVCDSPHKWNDKVWVTEQFGKYVRSNGQVLEGLVPRRIAEANLFCKPPVA